MVAKLALAAAATVANFAGAANASSAARANAANVQAQVENERRQAEIQASQQEQDRARRLSQTRSSQVALMASRGIDLNSWDAQATDDMEQYRADIRSIGINRMSKSHQLALQGFDAEQQARYQSRGAWLSAVGNSASAWMKVGSTTPTEPKQPKPTPAPTVGGYGWSGW
jgi:hypothetical protein